MAQHSRSTIIKAESKSELSELMRLSDEAYGQLLTALVNAEPVTVVPGISAEVECKLKALMEDVDDLLVTLLSLYVLRERVATSAADPASAIAESILSSSGSRNSTSRADAIRLANRLLVLLSSQNITEVPVEEPNIDPPGLGKNHPMAHLAGRYKDDPYFDRYLEELEKYRREVTERDLAELDLAESV